VRKSRKQEPPRSRSRGSLADSRLGLLELDRFTNTDITRWKKLSDDLDELNDLLYFGIEPQRQRHHETMRAPWPSLYLGENFETAYREKFQLDRGDRVDGLSPEELALNPGNSFTAVCLDGQLNRVFDVDEPGAFDPLCAVLRKIKLPAQVRQLQYRLKIPKHAIFMLRSASQLRTETLQKNWRAMPVQFGLPALSQILGSLILDAGFEAIRYPSTKGSGSCLAVFPHKLSSSQSYVALSDDPPAELRHARLDMDSADELCGWEMLRTNQQPRNGG